MHRAPHKKSNTPFYSVWAYPFPRMFIAYPNLEPLSTSDPEYDAIVKQTLSEYPRACICMIDRVRPPLAIEEAFEKKQRELEKKEKGLGKLMRVYHGTKAKNVTSIVTHGFDPHFGRVQAFGAGIYFATQFLTSWSYASTEIHHDDPLSHIFVCDILPGRLCLGVSNRLPSSGFDSQGNGSTVQESTYFAIPAADQMIPRFLVRFHKDSERIMADTSDNIAPPMPASVRAKLAQPSKRLKK